MFVLALLKNTGIDPCVFCESGFQPGSHFIPNCYQIGPTAKQTNPTGTHQSRFQGNENKGARGRRAGKGKGIKKHMPLSVEPNGLVGM
jgi:hypothetical protein